MSNRKDFQFNPLDRLTEMDADIISSNLEEARQYLQEEGINVDKEVEDGLNFIEGLLAQERLKEGKRRRIQFEKLLEKTIEKIQNNVDDLMADLEARGLKPQVQFRSFEGELSENEIKRIKEDVAIIAYIKQELAKEDEDKSQP